MSTTELPIAEPVQAKADPIRDDQLALMSNAIFDVPPRLRAIFGFFGLFGLAIIGIETLTPRNPGQVELDKLIHFCGYGILALTVVLALKSRFLPIGLFAIAGFGVVLEFFQLYTGREFDTSDMMANFYGISAGAFLGLVVRPVWSQISREMAKIRVQERLRNYEAGEVVFREGETADRFYLVKSGRLRGSKAMNDEPFELKEGSVLGLLGTLQGTPHFSTVEAVEPTVLYEMSLDELMEAAGDKQAPVRVVLSDMADTIRHLVEKP